MPGFIKTALYGGLFLVLTLFFWFCFLSYELYFSSLVPDSSPQKIIIRRGDDIHDLVNDLQARGLMHHHDIFLFLARFRGHDRRLRFGQYWIKPGMSLMDLLGNIVSGKGLVRYKVTFVEGWTFRHMREVLDKTPVLLHATEGKTNHKIMTMLGYPKQHPEGMFYPSTYLFTWGRSDLYVLKQAYVYMQRFLEKQWVRRATDLPYKNAYQALIVASIVEKETALDAERPLIAGIILKRLKIGMKLQVDPTVLYGVNKEYGAVITKRDLRAKNPYNTYQRYGLPPTPIDMPGAASIKAALHPEASEYLYYVSRGDGSHEFSRTYEQQRAAIRKYRVQESRWKRLDQDFSKLMLPSFVVKYCIGCL